MSDKTIDPELLAWVVETVRPGETPMEVRGLRFGGRTLLANALHRVGE